MSIRQADELAARLEAAKLPWNRMWHEGPVSTSGQPVTLPGGMRLTILSPGPEQLARLGRDWEEYRLKSVSPNAPPSDLGDESGEHADADADKSVSTPSIYLSYAQADATWAARIQEAIGHGAAVFHDAPIPKSGVEWQGEATRAVLANAALAVALVSPHALASEFVMNAELPAIIDAADRGQLRLAWLLLEPCAWQQTPLAKYMAVLDVDRPLSTLGDGELAVALKRLGPQLTSLAQDAPSSPRRARNRAGGPLDVEALAAAPFVADRAVANNASIAFLAEHDGRSLLVGSDASADVLAASIARVLSSRGHKRLRVDAFVVPHNGSARNLHRGLLELLDCDRYLIAGDGSTFGHPDRETIARILAYGRATPDRPLTLVFNYRTRVNEAWTSPQLQSRYNYRVVYPDGDGGGITVQL